MKKRIISLAIALAMILSVMPNVFAAGDMAVTAAPAASGVEFSDVAGTYYEAAAKRWASLGVISGDGAGKFLGRNNATRAQVAKIITLALGFDENVTATADFYGSFKDVVRGSWYIPYLFSLNAKDIMKGDGAGRIRPNDSITRQEFLVMLGRAAAMAQNESALKTSKLSGKEDVAAWAKGYVGAMIERGVIKGDASGSINAKANITRGEIVTIIDRLIKDYITEGGEYTLSGEGITVVKTSQKVSIKANSLKGNVVVAETAKKANVTIDGEISGAVSVNSNASVYMNGSADSFVIATTANGAYAQLGEKSRVTSFVSRDPKAVANIAGNVESATVAGGSVTVDKQGRIESVGVEGSGTAVTVNGEVKTIAVNDGTSNTNVNVPIGGEVGSITADGDDITVSGGGSVAQVAANGSNIAVNTPSTQVTAGAYSTGVTVGKTEAQSGAVVTGGGSGAVVSKPVETSGNPTQPVITEQPVGVNVRFMTSGEFLTVKAEEKENNSYSYQWYKNTEESYDGAAAVKDAKTAQYKVKPDEELIGKTEYWYCGVTAARGLGSLTTFSDIVKVTYATKAESYANAFVFGGFTIGSYSAIDTVCEMFKERTGVRMVPKGTYTSHSSTSSTYNVWELFVSTARSSMNNYSFSNANVETMLKETPFDYVIIQTGRDFSLNWSSNRTQNVYSTVKIALMAAKLNPDAQVVIVAPYGHTTGFDVDFSRAGIRTHRAQVSLANLEAELAASKINDEGVLNNKVKIAYVGDAFENYAKGDYDKMAKVLFRPDNGYYSTGGIRGYNTANRASAAGAYLSAAVIYGTLTGDSPAGMNTMGVTTNNANLDSTANDETAAVLAAANETANGLKFELLAAAQKTLSQQEAEKAEYTIQYYLIDDSDEFVHDPSKDEKGTAFIGMEKTVTGRDIAGYIEDVNKPERVATQVIAADGSTAFKLYYTNKVLTPEIITQPRSVDERKLSKGARLTVEVDEQKGHTYEYQWYEDNGEAVLIEGATEKTYIAPRTDEGVKKKYFCTIKATFNDSSAEAISNVAEVTFSNYINVYVFGGYTVGSYDASDILRQMLAETGEDYRITSVSPPHTAGWGTYNLNEIVNSGTQSVPADVVFATGSDGQNTKKAFEEGTDFIIIQASKENVFTNSTSKTNIDNLLRNLARMCAEANPDAQFIILAPYAHTVGFSTDFPTKQKGIEDYATHCKAINIEAEAEAAALNRDGYLTKTAQICYVTDAFNTFTGGDLSKVSALYRPDNGITQNNTVRGYNFANRGNAAGAYLTAAALYAQITGESPFGLETEGSDLHDGMLTSDTNEETASALAALGMGALELKLELQAAAEKTVLGTEPERATYKTEHYTQNAAKTGYDLYKTETGKAFPGVIKTGKAIEIEDYLENKEHADRVDSAEIEADGSTTFKFYYDRLSDEATLPVLTKDISDVTVKYATPGKTLRVAVEEAPGNTYTYQWFKNTTASNSGGVAIEGADGPSYKVVATDLNVGITEYYYVEVTAHRKSDAKTTASAAAAATFAKEPLNVYIFGGYTMGTYSTSFTLTEMLAEKTGLEINDVTVTTGHSQTWGTYNIFETFSSTARASLTDFSISNTKTNDAFKNTDLDYVIIQTSRETSQSGTNKVQNSYSMRKLAKLAATRNPDAQFVLVAPYAHTTGYASDFPNATQVMDYNSHVSWINAEAEGNKAEIEADGYLENNVRIAYVSNALASFADGDAGARALLYQAPEIISTTTPTYGRNLANRASAAGAYLAAATIFATVCEESPVGLETKGSSNNDADLSANSRAAELANLLGETVNGLVFELQKTAEKTVLGTEPEKAAFKVEHYLQKEDKTGYDLARTDTLEGYIGKEVTAKASMFEDYFEDTANAGRVASAVVTADGKTTFKLYYNKLADEAAPPSFKKLPATNVTVKYATLGETLAVEVEEQPGHTYTYQWYAGSDENAENAEAIEGATGTSIDLKATDDNIDSVKTYFCKVTAHRKTFTADAWTPAISVSFEKSPLNVFLWCGFPLSSYNVAPTLRQLIGEYLETDVNLTYSGLEHTTTYTTWNVWELFNSTSLTDYTIKNSTISSALTGSTPWDYVIFMGCRDFSLTSATSATNEDNCMRKVAKLASDLNPNVQFIIAAPYGHTTGFEKDFASLPGVSSHATHVAEIDKRAKAVAAKVDADGYLKTPVKIAYIGDAFEKYANGDATKLSTVLFRPYEWRQAGNENNSYVRGTNLANRCSAPGAYLAAATIFATMFGETPVGLTSLGYEGESVHSALDTTDNAETSAILSYLEQTPEQLALDLQTAAAETALN